MAARALVAILLFKLKNVEQWQSAVNRRAREFGCPSVQHLLLPVILWLTLLPPIFAQSTSGGGRWLPAGVRRAVAEQPAGGNSSVRAAAASDDASADEAADSTDGSARVTRGTGKLPNEHGQVYREYDITPYTIRVTSTARPEQALIDWILRETGYEAWHGEPLGVLSATRRKLRVYHTPEMQKVVADLVDRFVSSEAETWNFSLRVMTVDHPNWRERVKRNLTPVNAQTPGVSAWLLQREQAAVVMAELRRRSDFREHSSPHMLVSNGQPTVVSAMRNRTYIRDLALRPDLWQGFEAQPGQVEEGFSLEFSPLLSRDRGLIDAVIKLNIDQIERMIPVELETPTPAAPRQRTPIQVPQTAQFRFHERFRWPVGQVLLIGMGVVPLAVPVDAKATELVPGIPMPLMGKNAPRAELLVMIEAKGPSSANFGTNVTSSPPQRQGRTR